MASYDGILFMEGWANFVTQLDGLEVRLRRDKKPAAADRLLEAYVEFRTDMAIVAEAMAKVGTDELRRSERETRVRPDTLGGGGPRLEDNLHAEPIMGAGMIPGTLGVANLDELDRNVPWWVTNEYGNTTLADRHQRIWGIFTGAGQDMPPDADAGSRREHPLFMATAGGDAGPGTISNPIPARHFIEKAWPKIDAEWHLAVAAAKHRFQENLRAVLLMPV